MFNRRLVFFSACSGMLLFGTGLITLGAVAPGLKEKFHLNDISAGTLFSILPLGILTGSLIFGPLSDRYGYRILLGISSILMFAGFEGIAFSRSTGLLKICIFLFGLGGGAINGGTSAVVSDISEKDKAPNLSLLGVFFGLGALSMPFILGVLKNFFSFEGVVATVGLFTILSALFFFLIRFPPPKQTQRFPLAKSFLLLKDNALILIAFFLFCQSSFEAIINNWTTSYLIQELAISEKKALFALSLYLAGLTAMRLLLGSVFRYVSSRKLLIASFVQILLGCVLLKTGNTFPLSVTGLILLGAGLGGGFPIMLGFVGERFTELSGTAFSFVLVVALLGNMLVNYSMGLIAQAYGIHHLISVAFVELVTMVLLSIFIFKKINTK